MGKFDVEVHFEVEAESAEDAFGQMDASLNLLHLDEEVPPYELLEGAATCAQPSYDAVGVDAPCCNCGAPKYTH